MLCVCLIGDLYAMDARTRVGLNLVPAFVAAQKLVNPPAVIDVWLVYQQHDEAVKEQDAYLRKRSIKQGSGLNFVLRKLSTLSKLKPKKGTLLVAVQRFDDQEFETFSTYSRKNKLVNYSPYAGDVERGVVGGVLISDRIVPLLNMKALDQHGVSFKAFFMKVSARHDK